MVSQVEGQVSPVNLPSSRGLSTPGSPATTITVSPHLCRLKHTCIIISVSNTQTLTCDLIPCGCVFRLEWTTSWWATETWQRCPETKPSCRWSVRTWWPTSRTSASRHSTRRAERCTHKHSEQEYDYDTLSFMQPRLIFGKQFLKYTGFVDTLCSFANWKGTCDISEFVQ